MAAPVPAESSVCIFTETVNNVHKYLGYDGDITQHTNFHIPYSQKNRHNCDLCFPLVVRCWPRVDIPYCLSSPELKKSKISTNIERVCEDLPKFSKNWILPVKSCKSSTSSLCIFLERERAFCTLIPRIIDKGNSYGSLPSNGEHIYISKDFCPADVGQMNLFQLRMHLALIALNNILCSAGYSVMIGEAESAADDKSFQKFHITNKPLPNNMVPGCKPILCGVVLNCITGVKDTTTLAHEYYRRKLEEIKEMSANRTDYEENDEQIAIENTLAEAEALAELLFIKLHDPVKVRPNIDSEDFNTDHKGAAFMLYNHVRLLAIRRKFEQEVECGRYPPLPPFDNIDVGLLTQEDEWSLLQLLLKYHCWLRACISDIGKGKLSLHPLLIGLDQLCRTISVYYRRVRILTEPRSHLLPVMYARLYLIRAVEQVLYNGLTILGIKTLKQM